jgi:hypothetical protein
LPLKTNDLLLLLPLFQKIEAQFSMKALDFLETRNDEGVYIVEGDQGTLCLARLVASTDLGALSVLY